MEWFMFGDLTLTDLETGRAGLSASAELLVLLTTKHSGGFMVVGLGSAVKFGCLDSVGGYVLRQQVYCLSLQHHRAP